MNPTKRDVYFYGVAYKLAHSCMRRFAMSALLTKGPRIISLATNVKKSHPVTRRYYPNKGIVTVHAEQRALILAQSSGDTMYIARHALHGAAISRPCAMCIDLLHTAGVKQIVYHDGVAIVKERLS